ncbi:MAG: chemotaxis protein CheW [Rhodospirillaceae bacterium]
MSVSQDSGSVEAASIGGNEALLRVSAERVNRLMDLVGELSLCVSEVVRCPEIGGREPTEAEKTSYRLLRIMREVQDATTELRLGTVRELFGRLRRAARDLERQTGKSIVFDLEGEDTPIDKKVSDRLFEPLLHVIRNSVDHGLEAPNQRVAVGKPEAGQITLTAVQLGNHIEITVADDGKGLDRDGILARARAMGSIGAGEIPEESVLWKLVLQPGFSTAEQVTDLSGRGVGMDVLNTAMRELRGRIALDSKPGKGTLITLSIPVSLAFLDCLILRLGKQLFAAPVDAVSEILQPDSDQSLVISAEDGSEMLLVQGSFVPVCRLQHFYGDTLPVLTPLDRSLVIIFSTSIGRFALPVDEIIDQQQVVMKPLVGQLEGIRAGWGCALLGNGSVALVLDCEKLAEGMRS